MATGSGSTPVPWMRQQHAHAAARSLVISTASIGVGQPISLPMAGKSNWFSWFVDFVAALWAA